MVWIMTALCSLEVQHQVAEPVDGRERARRHRDRGGRRLDNRRTFDFVAEGELLVIVDRGLGPAGGQIEEGAAPALDRGLESVARLGQLRQRRFERQIAHRKYAIGDELQPRLAIAGALAVKLGVKLL